MNPCRCGHMGDDRRECTCSPRGIEKYRARISGPLLDRIDLHVNVPALSFKEMSNGGGGESSAIVAARVAAARERQAARYRRGRTGAGGGDTAATGASEDYGATRAFTIPALTNARVRMSWLVPSLDLDAVGEKILEDSMKRLSLSARGHDRILRVARTIADLDGSDRVRSIHVAEAVRYRVLDKPVTNVDGTP